MHCVAFQQLLAGSDVNAVNKPKQTPLHLAAMRNEATIASVLIENGADVGAVDQNGNNGWCCVRRYSCVS